MAYRLGLAGCVFFASVTFASFAGGLGKDLASAPPAFMSNSKLVIPIDIQAEKVSFRFNAKSQKTSAVARVEFFSRDAGYPMLDLLPSPTSVKLNGKDLGTSAFSTVKAPDNVTTFRMLDEKVAALSTNLLEVAYDIPASLVTYGSDGVKMGFFMVDVSTDRAFWEQYGPASFEYDQFGLEVSISVEDSPGDQELFSNGEIEELGEHSWRVRFPRYFTSSSPFLHLTNGKFLTRNQTYRGRARSIPITVYGTSQTSIDKATDIILEVMEENEETYGPFAHPQFIAYITSAGGGMEYCGATVTSVSAVEHELTHSWFARGVMPSSGNSGWIDEAVASWRDDDYPVNEKISGSPVNLAGHSPYRRTTPAAAYVEGNYLMGYLDGMFRKQGIGGLKEILASLFTEKQHQTITTPFLQKYLEGRTNVKLDSTFLKFVYGKANRNETAEEKFLGSSFLTLPPIPKRRHHPRAYTAAELQAIR